MNHFLLVFIGGGLGSVSRYAVSLMMKSFGNGTFPIATLTANAASSFILGLVLGQLSGKQDPASGYMMLFLAVGFCGGFSTFSTFSFETLELLKSGNTGAAVLNIFTNLAVCLLLTVAGIQLSK